MSGANAVAECKNTPACAPYKSTFDECVERVTTTIDEKGEANEDCVEECTLYPPLSPTMIPVALPWRMIVLGRLGATGEA